MSNIVQLPTEWRSVPLRQICERSTTWNPLREKRDEFWYIDVSAISRDSFSIRSPQKIKSIEAPSRARKIVRTGDVIFATVRPTLRRVALVGQEFDNQIASTAFCIIRADRKTANPYYLYYLLLTDFMNAEIAKFEAGASYPAVNDKDILDRIVPLPPTSEQQKIATVLWKVQRAIELEEKFITTTRELKHSAMRQLFHSDSEDDFPKKWKRAYFEELAELHRGYDLPKSERKTGTIPVIGSNGIVGFNNEAKLNGPGVITGRSGTIGLSFYIESPYWPLNTGLYVSDFKGNLPLFVHYFFQFFNFSNYSAGVSVPTLNRNLVHQAEIRIPELKEQKEIAKILQSIDLKIAFHERKKSTLQELFRSLLHQLMTGQIRVKKLDINVSEIV